MTERFTITGAGISDHEKKRLYDLKTVDGLISLCEVLNELHEETLILKRRMESKQKVIDAYDNYIKTLKEDGVLE